MSRGERGLVLGKFLPPHAGHLHLVEVARRLTPDLTVLVCTLRREPIAGALRFAWMRELCPEARVVHVTDEVPAAPEESPDFWPIWLALIRREAAEVDVVYTSEGYGDELAARLGARHVCVDRARSAFPVSGTAARADPLGHWEYLPPPVRAFYCRRIALVGPESVGKSTLAEQLAAALGTEWVAEYGREHTDPIPLPHGLTLRDIAAIGAEQCRREEAAARRANRALVCDTDSLTTELWSELYFGTCPEPVRARAREPRYALHLLCDVDLPWADDGTRHHRHERERHAAMIRAALDERGWPYEIVRGAGPARLESALRAIRRRLPELSRWLPR